MRFDIKRCYKGKIFLDTEEEFSGDMLRDNYEFQDISQKLTKMQR